MMWLEDADDADKEECDELVNTTGKWSVETLKNSGMQLVTIIEANDDSTFTVKRGERFVLRLTVTRKELFAKFPTP